MHQQLIFGLALTLIAGVSVPAAAQLDQPPAHTHNSGNSTRPGTYSAAVHMLREELGRLDLSRKSGNVAELAQGTDRLAALAADAATLSDTLTNAYSDPSHAAIKQAVALIASTAAELRENTIRGIAVGTTPPSSRFTEAYDVLDAYVLKQYVCPMHCEPGKVYDRPGNCPVCAMTLQLITTERYSVAIEPSAKAIRAGIATSLHFQIRDPAGFAAARLQVVHEKLLHLMIVSKDLSWFDHVHPVPGNDGSFDLRYTFPTGGTYVLFHDFTPDHVGMQVVPVELDVVGRQPAPVRLQVSGTASKRVGGYEVTLTHTALGLDIDCAMTFTLTRGGQPVSDLEPFLGAMGHLVMISEDRQSYVHSHPLEQNATHGPSVQFNMTFSRTGLYKAWGQFQRRGRVVTVPFVVEVSLDGHSGNHGPAEGTSGSR